MQIESLEAEIQGVKLIEEEKQATFYQAMYDELKK